MRVFEFKLLSNGDMSGNINSPPQQLLQMAVCAIQAVWTGASASGTLKLQISNDYSADSFGNVLNAGTWTDYTGSTTTVNGAGNFMWNLNLIGYPYVRVVYTSVSGTGSLNITVNGKGP